MTWTRNDIDALLRRSDKAVERAMVTLYELQRADEQRSTSTHLDNTVGFSAFDARAGSRFARWVLGYNDKDQAVYEPKSLTADGASRIFWRYCKNGEQVIDRARRIALKHSRQLTDVANGVDLQRKVG